MTLWTVWVESSELSADWSDGFYVAARDEAEAKSLAERALKHLRPMADITGSEAHRYGGEAKVITHYDPQEED